MPEPRTPRNTTRAMREDADGLLFLATGMFDRRGGASFIEEQEANGQREMVNSDVIPAGGYADADLIALGFTLGDPVEGDPLFRRATLPDGWRREGTDHAMHSSILDTLGRKRCGIFYKAAFYDRRADLRINSVGAYVSACLYDGTTPILDEAWATAEAVHVAIAEARAYDAERAEFWKGRGKPEYVADHMQTVKKCDALKARVEALTDAEITNA